MATRAPAFRPSATDSAVDLNTVLQEQAAARREDFESTRRPMLDYAKLIPEQDRPMELEPGGDWAFQIEPFYSDVVAAAREVVYKKSTQVGASAGTVRWGVRECDQYGRRVIYTFPTDTHVRDFGDERIEPSIEASPYLRKRIPAGYVKNKHLKRIGRGFLYLRGAKSRTGAQSIGGGSIVFDEYDELEPRIVEQFERRLSGAKQRGEAPRLRRLGIPTAPGFGIDRLYDESDQREWHVTCPDCGHEQTIEWARNVRWTMPGDDTVYRAGHDAENIPDPKSVGDVWRCCGECAASLEGKAIREGRWIARNPGAETIGYYVHRLIVPNTDLHEIVRNSRKTSPAGVEAFHNNDLGLAYSPVEAHLTEKQILAACSYGLYPQDYYRGPRPVVAGLDVASERDLSLWVDVLQEDGRAQALCIRELKSFEDVIPLMDAYMIRLLVIDSMPERRMARSIAARFPGRVVLAEYVVPRFGDQQPDALAFDPKKNIVKLNRTEVFDASFEAVRQARSNPLKEPPPGFVEQLQAPKRRTETDDQDRTKRVYVTPPSMADDYAHAGNYVTAARELYKLMVHAGIITEQARGKPHGPQEAGFRQHRLNELSDDYTPGFGE